MGSPHLPTAGSNNGPADEHPQLVGDPLDMLVTSDPISELDDALNSLRHQLQQAQDRDDLEALLRLRRSIDRRLDERNDFSCRR